MSGVTVLHPEWLWALPLLGLAALWLWRRRGAAGDWGRVADPGLLAAMAAMGRVAGGAARGATSGASLVLAALLALALAGPAVERRDAVSYRNLDGVLFVVDLSAGFADGPGWPDMRAAVQLAVTGLGARPAGLIVFAGDAYTAFDMSADHRELAQTLLVLDAETVPDEGASPARALALARERLRLAEVLAGDVVMLTGGAGVGAQALAEAAQIAEAGARVSVVTDAPQGAVLAAGGGRVFAPQEAGALAAWLSDGARPRLERQGYRLLFWHDLGRYLLALALLPVLVLFRRAGS
ncbi:MAG: VWA domain-containing protein [Alphaproteobacteria bacterium HGW-Alphaproteobacteria-1]|jgi:Ca-activated chloride channel family protein|nr:MAG: VWA domain-containing protein [Alphaproteobacteria bacterium HGW-Alphaproteobacteria-1]